MAKKNSVPARQHIRKKKENKFIDMPKDQFIKVCIITVVVIAAIVAFFVIRDRFDGHLDVVDSLPVMESDNWIVANTGTTDSPRYYKIGEIGEVEGYTREYNASSRMQTMTCSDESVGISTAYVMAANGEFGTLAENVRQNLTAYMTGAVIGDMDESPVGTNEARGFSCLYSYPLTDSETGEATGETNYTNGYYIYMRAGRGQSILCYTSSSTTDESELASEEVLKAEALKLASAIVVE
ncbi:MAG: hypothetical protein Q4D04_02945 [Clostridia bacterium]|nr:hypothetical protein [Clostridia bacterium]